jgi:phytoene dehydrogenase-like protein
VKVVRVRELCKATSYDAVIIGSGPNGVAAAIVLAQKGLKVVLLEARETIGGGCRSAELTLPGFTHDICSSIHPLGLGSPFFRQLDLEKFGLKWVAPDGAYAHPLDGGRAGVVYRSIEKTAETLGRDGKSYIELMKSINPDWDKVCESALDPLNLFKMFRHPFALGFFGLKAMMPAQMMIDTYFQDDIARGLLAGVCAHAELPFTAFASASFGLVLGATAHILGWPMPAGGAQRLIDALVAKFESLGGEVVTSCPVNSLDDLPQSRFTLCDISPEQLLTIAGNKLPAGYAQQLRNYTYGPGVFKLDYALSGPVPWAT